MPRGRPYSQEVRAAALAALATGESASSVARRLGIPRFTLIGWRKEANLPVPAASQQQKRLDIGEQLWGYLEESIETLRFQLIAFRDDAWLKKQSAGDLAILHGVIADKTTRLLAAVQRAEQDAEPADALAPASESATP